MGSSHWAYGSWGFRVFTGLLRSKVEHLLPWTDLCGKYSIHFPAGDNWKSLIRVFF